MAVSCCNLLWQWQRKTNNEYWLAIDRAKKKTRGNRGKIAFEIRISGIRPDTSVIQYSIVVNELMTKVPDWGRNWCDSFYICVFTIFNFSPNSTFCTLKKNNNLSPANQWKNGCHHHNTMDVVDFFSLFPSVQERIKLPFINRILDSIRENMIRSKSIFQPKLLSFCLFVEGDKTTTTKAIELCSILINNYSSVMIFIYCPSIKMNISRRKP